MFVRVLNFGDCFLLRASRVTSVFFTDMDKTGNDPDAVATNEPFSVLSSTVAQVF